MDLVAKLINNTEFLDDVTLYNLRETADSLQEIIHKIETNQPVGIPFYDDDPVKDRKILQVYLNAIKLAAHYFEIPSENTDYSVLANAGQLDITSSSFPIPEA